MGRTLGEGMGNRGKAPKRRVVRLYLPRSPEADAGSEGADLEVIHPYGRLVTEEAAVEEET
ncbi:MAG TPA: hypothetical protein VGK74_11455 [Symbiobacteriaceae bacterium]